MIFSCGRGKCGTSRFKKGTFFQCPWTKVYQFSTENIHVQPQEMFLSFLYKNSQQNLSSRLAGGLNFYYIRVFLHTHALPHKFRVQSRWNRQNRPILTIFKNLRSKSAWFCTHTFIKNVIKKLPKNCILLFSVGFFQKVRFHSWKKLGKISEWAIWFCVIISYSILQSVTQDTVCSATFFQF